MFNDSSRGPLCDLSQFEWWKPSRAESLIPFIGFFMIGKLDVTRPHDAALCKIL